MLQRGVLLGTLDASYVSSTSWYFLVMFGLKSLINLFLRDTSSQDEVRGAPLPLIPYPLPSGQWCPRVFDLPRDAGLLVAVGGARGAGSGSCLMPPTGIMSLWRSYRRFLWVG